MIVHSMMVCIFCSVLLFGATDIFAQDDESYHISIKENVITKLGHADTVKIDGKIPYSTANMTVTYPDGTAKVSSVTVTKHGYMTGFVSLGDEYPSGLYIVNIISFEDKMTHTFESHFFLSDYDGMVDVTIQRNAAISCISYDGTTTISDDCVSPKTTHIPKTFGMRFLNSDYKSHQFNVGGMQSEIILPDGDYVLYPERIGEYKYFCTIHPWIGGMIHVTDVPSLRFSLASIIDDKTLPKSSSDIVQLDVIQNYDETCSMCYVGKITKIIDGDTIHVDGKTVRLSLVDTPEKRDEGFKEATQHTKSTCPVGSFALVDIDDGQPQDKFGRQIAKVICGDVNLNESLLQSGNAVMFTSFCVKSEFMYESWASSACGVEDHIIEKITTEKIPDTPKVNFVEDTNSTGIVTIPQEIAQNNNWLIFIFLFCAVIGVIICLIFKKSSRHSTSANFITWKYLE